MGVIATLTGTKEGGIGGRRKYALIHTDKNQWLIHQMMITAQ
jgi:hypothetical protein